MNLVNLKTFTTEPEAEIFRVFMENSGVEGFIFDVNSSTIYPMFNNTIGGFQLKVRQEDLEKAQELLEEFYRDDDSDYDAEDENAD